MTLLSTVTVVEKPSPQPDTPQPMSGPALETFVIGPFIDPPANGADGFSLFLQYDNPVPGAPTNFSPGVAEENDDLEPTYVWGAHTVTGDWDWGGYRPDFVDSQPFNAFLPANCGDVHLGVYRGTTNPETITLDVAAQTALNTFTTTMNGNTTEINALLNKTPASEDYSENSYSILSSLLNSTEATPPAERPVHAWVMCGDSYIFTNRGNIYKSTDAFKTNSAVVGNVVGSDNIIKRIHPGVIESDPVGF